MVHCIMIKKGMLLSMKINQWNENQPLWKLTQVINQGKSL